MGWDFDKVIYLNVYNLHMATSAFLPEQKNGMYVQQFMVSYLLSDKILFTMFTVWSCDGILYTVFMSGEILFTIYIYGLMKTHLNQL